MSLARPAAATAASLREALREASGPAHQRLEDALALTDGAPDRLRFEALVAGFRGFHAAWEPALAEALQAPAWVEPRRRLALIDRDLTAFGWDRARIDALPTCTDAARLCDHPARAAGSLYVLEGSTLGGRVISRHIADAPWCPADGLRTFDPYGVDSGRRWRETLAWLEALPADRWNLAVDGCLDTFDLLLRWLPHRMPTQPPRTPHPALPIPMDRPE